MSVAAQAPFFTITEIGHNLQHSITVNAINLIEEEDESGDEERGDDEKEESFISLPPLPPLPSLMRMKRNSRRQWQLVAVIVGFMYF